MKTLNCKYTWFLPVLFLIASCNLFKPKSDQIWNRNPVYKVHIDTGSVQDYKPSQKIYIIFENGFDENYVQLYANNILKNSDTLTTLPQLGLAKSYEFDTAGLKFIQIKIKGISPVIIQKQEGYKNYVFRYYNYIYVNISEQKPDILITNKPHYYK